MYAVLTVYRDRDDNEYLELEKVYATRELAEEDISFQLRDLRIAEYDLCTEPTSFTKHMKIKVADGTLEVKNNSLIFK